MTLDRRKKSLLVCIRCGHQNPDRQKYCESCNASLPRISEAVSAPPHERINVHYNQLKEAGEKIQSGDITQEQYLEVLDRISTIIMDRLKDLEGLEISEEVRASVEEELQLGLSGIQYFLQGIDEMRVYLEDPNPEHISVGLESIYQGNENLNVALEMARDNIRRLKDMGIESEIDTRDIP